MCNIANYYTQNRKIVAWCMVVWFRLAGKDFVWEGDFWPFFHACMPCLHDMCLWVFILYSSFLLWRQERRRGREGGERNMCLLCSPLLLSSSALHVLQHLSSPSFCNQLLKVMHASSCVWRDLLLVFFYLPPSGILCLAAMCPLGFLQCFPKTVLFHVCLSVMWNLFFCYLFPLTFLQTMYIF